MIKESISPAYKPMGSLESLMSASNRSREPDSLHARERTPRRSKSTAVVLPFPTARVRKGRRGKISGFADRHLAGSSGSQLSRHIETIGLAPIDYVALAIVLASVASGPLLVWFLLRTAH
jgi:hypothetical protein